MADLLEMTDIALFAAQMRRICIFNVFSVVVTNQAKEIKKKDLKVTGCQLLESKDKQVDLICRRCNLSSVTSSLGHEHSLSHEWHLHNLIAHSQSSSQK